MHKCYLKETLLSAAQLAISVAVLSTCVYTYANCQRVTCMLARCDSPSFTVVMSAFPRAVAISCALSRVAVMYNACTGATRAYNRNADNYDAHIPAAADKATARRAFASAVVVACAVAVLPVNAYRIRLLRYRFPDDRSVTVFFAMMYTQNASTCVTEVQFVVHCFALYLEFRSINEAMAAVAAGTVAANRYPPALTSDRDDRDMRPPFDVVERLKLRHRFVRDAARDLNQLYGIQLGSSLCVLYIMALFDVYEVVSSELYTENSDLFLHAWLVQYAFRFCVIVLTTHATTKQAHKSKMLVTDTNNRYIDNYTKEELRLFLDELSSHSVEFTTFDLVTLNTHLITSAIVAGTTYLIILLQFRKN